MHLFELTKYSQNTIAIDSFNKEYSYNDLSLFIKDIGVVLNRGLMVCLCKNHISSLFGYLAFIENNIPTIMLDAQQDVGLTNDLIEHYKPNYIWLPDDLKSGYIKNDTQELFSYSGYSLLYISNYNHNLHPNLALLLPTSGSTGSPKLVRLTKENLKTNAESIANYLNITSKERPITSLPMHYSYGISVINSHVISGATILLTDYSVIQKEFWNFAKQNEATSMAGVPYIYEMLRRLRVFQMDLPALKTFTQAGGKLNPKLVKEYLELAHQYGKQFIVMYGQTEATARMSYLPFDNALEKYESIGKSIPGGRFILIDSDGNEISNINEDGELVYFGKNVSMGYAEFIDDLAKADENNGMLRTGDVARFDADGYYYITGRLKRFVKIYGNRVSLDEIEHLLKSLIMTCACVGVDDKITVFVSNEVDTEKVIPHLTNKTGLNYRAFAVKQINEIPKNSSGKILYNELMKLID